MCGTVNFDVEIDRISTSKRNQCSTSKMNFDVENCQPMNFDVENENDVNFDVEMINFDVETINFDVENIIITTRVLDKEKN